MTDAFVYGEPAVPVSKLRFLAEENHDAALHWRSLGRHGDANMWHRTADEISLLADEADAGRSSARVERPDPQEAEALARALPPPSPQSDGAGALPTSPSPEVGVATSPPAPSLDIEEPQEFGSIVRASSEAYEEQNWTPIPRTGEHWWHSETGRLEKWRDLVDPEVLRIGVGTDEQAKADEAVTYNNGYEKGAADAVTRAIATGNTFRAGWAKGNADTYGRITGELTDLKPALITAPEKTAIDKAIALIAADHEDTVVGRGYPS